MMRKTNNARKSHRIDVRLTCEENAEIDNLYKISTCRSKAQYVRELLFNRPIRIFHRNQSLDDLIEEITMLNGQITTLKDSLSKNPEILSTDSDKAEESLRQNQTMINRLYSKMDEVKIKMEKITDKWLQS